MLPGQIAAELRLLREAVIGLDGKVNRILGTLNTQGILMASSLQTLTEAVAANTSAIGSAKMALVGLKASLDAAIAALPDQSALDALSVQLGTDDASLAAAIVANTPAAPVPSPTP